MQYFATFDDAGLPTGFYLEAVSGPILLPTYGDLPDATEDEPEPVAPVIGSHRNPAFPSGVVEISEGQWRELIDNSGRRCWNGTDVVPYEPAPLPVAVPDNPTLSDWRVALTLWQRPDGTLRIDEVTAKVAALVEAGNPLGRIARERLEYANNVLRAQLVQLRSALGFTEAEIDESLWRADRVRLGDLSGVWPLPAGKGTAA